MNNILINKKSKTNWKYLLIVIILTVIVGGGISIYQYWLFQKEMKLPEIKKPILEKERKVAEVPFEELKVGRNQVENVIVEKIKPIEIKSTVIQNNIAQYEINKIKISVNKEIHEYTIYYKDNLINTGKYPTTNPIKISTFTYKDNEYYIISSSEIQQFNVHEFYVFTHKGELKSVKDPKEATFILFESSGYEVIGYNEFLYVMSSNFSPRNGYTDLDIYALNGDSIKYRNHFEAFVDNSNELRVISLVLKDKKLFLKINSNFIHYPLAGYYSLGNEYYLLDNGRLVKSNLEFKQEYLKESARYDKILQENGWKENDWSSSLLSRTLNLIFAGEEEKAWQEFFEDFAKFFQKYPLPEIEKIDPNKIKEEIQKQLKESIVP